MTESITGAPKQEPKEAPSEQFELTFKNGALANLKKLAKDLNISEDNLGEAVNKSIKLLSIVKNVNAKKIVLENENKDRFVLDSDSI